MPKKDATDKAPRARVERQHSLLEDQYSEIFRAVDPKLQPRPLPDNMSLEQPSPFVTIPSIATDAVLEDVTVTETWEATPNT